MYRARSSGLTVAGTPAMATVAAGADRAATDACGAAAGAGAAAGGPGFLAGALAAAADWVRAVAVGAIALTFMDGYLSCVPEVSAVPPASGALAEPRWPTMDSAVPAGQKAL